MPQATLHRALAPSGLLPPHAVQFITYASFRLQLSNTLSVVTELPPDFIATQVDEHRGAVTDERHSTKNKSDEVAVSTSVPNCKFDKNP